MRNRYGFTLLELMVVLAISAILSTLAAPSFTQMIQSNTTSSNVNNFLADMRFARSESIRRGGGVVMCRSDAPEVVNPTCGSGLGSSGHGWTSGWIIFQDWNNNGVQDTNEPLLRVKAPVAAIDSITEGDGTTSTQFRFTATGRLSTSPTQLHFGGNYASNVQRLVCVDLGGRTRTSSAGTVDCGSQ